MDHFPDAKYSGPFLRIFQWRGQLRKGTSERKGKVEKCSLLGGPPENFCIFEFPRLDFLQFPTKKGPNRVAKTLQWGVGGGGNIGAGGGGGGALTPPVYML